MSFVNGELANWREVGMAGPGKPRRASAVVVGRAAAVVGAPLRNLAGGRALENTLG